MVGSGSCYPMGRMIGSVDQLPNGPVHRFRGSWYPMGRGKDVVDPTKMIKIVRDLFIFDEHVTNIGDIMFSFV